MQHVLQISRKIEYGLRAMIYLAGLDEGSVAPLAEIAQRKDVPRDFLAKILKSLCDKGLVRSTRGVRGGFALARAARDISFLDVIEAVEGPVHLNVCLDPGDNCSLVEDCTMHGVWREGQDRMLDVYRATRLDQMVGRAQAPGPARAPARPGAVPLPVVGQG
jgi:Rrf2 family protein